jgi:TRAP-type uncharacterized transport system substrate-binding protein
MLEGRTWIRAALALAAGVAAIGALAAILEFLAPTLAYQVRDRLAERFSGRGGRPFRIALGVNAGSYFRVGEALNRHLMARSGYELELVATAGVPENVAALLDPTLQIDLATIESSSDEAVTASGIYGLAAIGRQYFFVIVPDDSPVGEIRDLRGPVNPGVRGPGQAPTLGEKVLEYYGLLAAAGQGASSPVAIVRPLSGGLRRDFDAGHMTAATRTQFLHSDLVDDLLVTGGFRLVAIRDHEALARALPGTEAGTIPAGVYGPARRLPVEPVPTLTVSTLLVARGDVPGRVVRDVLEVIYDPRFGREIRSEITEQAGRRVGGLPLHPAADLFYRRDDLVTSDRIGRATFVASILGAIAAVTQFALRFRQAERRRVRRRMLESELDKLNALRRGIETAPTLVAARALASEADDLLTAAEREAASERLDAEGVESLRSVHALCSRALQQRMSAAAAASLADHSDLVLG